MARFVGRELVGFQSTHELVPVESSSDTRSPMAKAIHLAGHITSVSLMMVLPAGGGFYVDNYFHTKPLFMIFGLVLGLVAGFWQLFKLVQEPSQDVSQETPQNRSDND